MLVSIIIPIYNTPVSTFKDCLSRIIEQDYAEIEVIIIDDGSDQAFSKQYAEASTIDERIQYHYYSNHGVSFARNRGVEKASGEYIIFVDSDDLIDKSFIHNAVSCLSEEKYDLVIGRIVYIPDYNSKQVINERKALFDTNVVLNLMFSIESKNEDGHILASPCGRLYRTAIAKTVKFDETIKYFEDQLYNLEFIKKANSFLIVPEDWYYYYQNSYSALHAVHKKWDDLCEWDLFLDRWILLTADEENQETDQLFTKYLITYFFKEVEEGLLAGERYERKKIKGIMNKPPFLLMAQKLEAKDFISNKRKLQFLLIKSQFSFLIYILAWIKNSKAMLIQKREMIV